MRGTLVVDTKLLRDHFLRQQRGGNIAGYRGARFQRGYGIGDIYKSLYKSICKGIYSLKKNKVNFVNIMLKLVNLINIIKSLKIIYKSLARYAIPLFKKGAKFVGKRALQAATEVGQDVIQGKNV